MRVPGQLAVVFLGATFVVACGGDDEVTPFFEQECPPLETGDEPASSELPVFEGAVPTSADHINDVDLLVQVLDGTTIPEVKEQMDALRPEDAVVLHDEEEQYDTELTWQAEGQLWITAARVVCAERVEVRLSVQDAPT